MSDSSPGRPSEQPAPPPAGGDPGSRGAGERPGRATGKQDAPPAKDPLRGSRTSGIWVALTAIGVLLVLLVVFTLQNTQQVAIAFLGWEGQAPLSAAILIAAAAGILITAIAGSLRILQLRRRVKHQR